MDNQTPKRRFNVVAPLAAIYGLLQQGGSQELQTRLGNQVMNVIGAVILIAGLVLYNDFIPDVSITQESFNYFIYIATIFIGENTLNNFLALFAKPKGDNQ